MSGRVVWITGLSGAGKSTVSAHLRPHLLRADPKTIFLDGDDLRAVMAAASVDGADHGRAQRLELAQRYARLCRLLALQDFTVVIATISLFREVHEWNRNNLPGYVEVYLKVPVEELRRRDPRVSTGDTSPETPEMWPASIFPLMSPMRRTSSSTGFPEAPPRPSRPTSFTTCSAR